MYLLTTQTHIFTTHQSWSDVEDCRRRGWPLGRSPARRVGADQHLTPGRRRAGAPPAWLLPRGRDLRRADGRRLPAASVFRRAEALLRRLLRLLGRELPLADSPPTRVLDSLYGRRIEATPRDLGVEPRGHQNRNRPAGTNLLSFHSCGP